MKSNSNNRTKKYQVRLTEQESKLLDKRIAKCGMNRSDYIRSKLIYENKDKGNIRIANFMVLAQEFLNGVEENGLVNKKIRKKVEELWNVLI